MRQFLVPAAAALASLALVPVVSTHGEASLSASAFADPPEASKVHAWWHWINGGVTREGITKDLESMREQGVVQATILNIGGYAASDIDVPFVTFNTPEWYAMFRHSLDEAERLGMSIGMHNCDGWSTSGGPWVKPEDSMKSLVWSRATVEGGREIKLQLDQPPTREKFYEDVVVLAYPNRRAPSPYVEADPDVRVGDSSQGDRLHDGNERSTISFSEGRDLTVSFDKPRVVDEIAFFPFLEFTWGRIATGDFEMRVLASENGRDFKRIADVKVTGGNVHHRVKLPKTRAKSFRIESTKNPMGFDLSELELLTEGEPTAFSDAIKGLVPKTAAVKDQRHDLLMDTGGDASAAIEADEVMDISKHVDKRGALRWNAPEGDWSIVRFGYTSTGMKNKPATPAGVGLEIDKMDPAAAELHFDAFIGQLLDAAGDRAGSIFKFIMVDSWECKFQTWTKKFPEEFAERQDYEIHRWLPVFAGEVVGSLEESNAFLHDFRETVGALMEENYYKKMGELSRAAGLEFHSEAIYGGGTYPPLDVLSANKHADLPMVEFWARPDNKTFLPQYKPADHPVEYLPAYANLAYGKRKIGAEAYTNRYYFSEVPADLKAHGDAVFSSGINQLIFHSYVHQPFDRPLGVTLKGWGGPFNRNNPWWNHSSEWLEYQNRLQYVLQQGEPVVDCIFFVGDEEPQRRNSSLHRDLPFGHRTNACNLEMLRDQAEVIDGKLSFGGEQTFAFLALHRDPTIELETLRILAGLVEDGLVLYGPRPERPLGLQALQEHQDEFKSLVEKLWGPGDAGDVDRTVGEGRVVWGMSVSKLIDSLELTPDLASSATERRDLMWIHKRTGDADVYFVFNQTEEPLHTELLFRVTDRQPEVWQAETGESFPQAIYSVEGDQTRLPVSFKPRESFLFVFRDGDTTQGFSEVVRDGKTVFPAEGKLDAGLPKAALDGGKVHLEAAEGGEYALTLDGGETVKARLAEPLEIALENETYEVSFEPLYDADIKPIEMSPLKSITEVDDEQIKHFAGTLRYRMSFELTDEQLQRLSEATLDLGRFDALAVVTLNGEEVAKVWNPHTRTPVGGKLQRRNVLEVEVPTVGRNRVIGDMKEYGKLKSFYSTAIIEGRFTPELPLKPVGLFGPVRLRSVETAELSLR